MFVAPRVSLTVNEIAAESPYIKLPKISLHTTFRIKNRLIIFGGAVAQNVLLNNVCVYNIEYNKWSVGCPSGMSFPHKRRGCASTVISENEAFIHGGEGEKQFLGDSWILKDETEETDTSLLLLKMRWRKLNTWGGLPCPRYAHSIAKTGKHLYLFGGYGSYDNGSKTSGLMFDDTLFKLDMEMFCWEKVATRGHGPHGRHFHSMKAFQDSLFLFGGYLTEQKEDSLIFEFNVISNEWSLVNLSAGIYPPLRGECDCCVVGDTVYFVYPTEEADRTVWAFDMAARMFYNSITIHQPFSCRKECSLVVSTDNSFFITGGKYANGKLCNTILRVHIEDRQHNSVEGETSTDRALSDVCTFEVIE